jgi:glycosyltransferase involved in cell wall biosynthesis
MKVRNCVIVCDSAEHSGGISAVVLAQTRGLVEAGIRVFVFAAFGPVDTALAHSANGITCMQPRGFERHHLAEVWNLAAPPALLRVLAGFSPQDTVVHIHSLSMGLSPSIAPALKRAGYRYLVTAHDSSWACPTGLFYNVRKQEYCMLQPLSAACLGTPCEQRNPVFKGYKVIKTWALDHGSGIKRDAALILTPSEVLTHRLRSRVPASTPVLTLNNPIDTPRRAPRAHAGEYFVFVGRLCEEKGILELLQALGERYPLLIVGDGPLRAELVARYPQVVFTGWLAPAEVLLAMGKAIALVLPSLYLEAFGMVVAEALSQGVPAIVSQRAGACSLIEHGTNGFVVDMAEPLQLQRACDALMDPRNAHAMSQAAHRRYWETPLDTARYVTRLLAHFDGIAPP